MNYEYLYFRYSIQSLFVFGSDTFYIANSTAITACVLSFVYVITEKL